MAFLLSAERDRGRVMVSGVDVLAIHDTDWQESRPSNRALRPDPLGESSKEKQKEHDDTERQKERGSAHEPAAMAPLRP